MLHWKTAHVLNRARPHTRAHRDTLLGASQPTRADKVGYLPQQSAEFRSLATIYKLQIVNR